MIVFAIKGSGDYCGGMAIVAARTMAEAIGLADNYGSQYGVSYSPPESVDELPVKYDGEPAVLAIHEYGE